MAGDDVEHALQELGFGYRARYIAESARQIVSKGGLQHLCELRDADYATAKASLMELHGVGAKVCRPVVDLQFSNEVAKLKIVLNYFKRRIIC